MTSFRTQLIGLLLGAAVLLLGNCSNDKSPKLVTSAAGGVLVIPGEIRLDIPPGALAEDTVVTIEALGQQDHAAAEFPFDLTPSGKTYSISPAGLEFLIPATLTMYFPEGEVPANTETDDLRIYTSTDWTVYNSLAGNLDTDEGAMSGEISSLATYVIGTGEKIGRGSLIEDDVFYYTYSTWEGPAHLVVVDISDKGAPETLADVELPTGGAWDIASDGSEFLYITSRQSGIFVLRKDELTAGAVSTCTRNDDGFYLNAYFENGYLFTTDLKANTFNIHKIFGTAPDNCVIGDPVETAGGIQLKLPGSRAYSMAITGSTASISSGAPYNLHTIDFDVSGSAPVATLNESIAVAGSFFDIATSTGAIHMLGGGPYRIYDESNQLVSGFTNGGSLLTTSALEVIGRSAYLFNGSGYIRIDVSDPASPVAVAENSGGGYSTSQAGNYILGTNAAGPVIYNVGTEVEVDVTGLTAGQSFDLYNSNTNGGLLTTITGDGIFPIDERIADGNNYDFRISNLVGTSNCQFFLTGIDAITGSMDITSPPSAFDIECGALIIANEAYIKPGNSESWDLFGSNVAIDGDTLLVAAYYDDGPDRMVINGTGTGGNGRPDAGAVFVYRRIAGVWQQEAYLQTSNGDEDDYFGIGGVAIDGDVAVVGTNYEESNQTTVTNGATASTDNSLTRAGAAYVFRRTGTTWVQEAYLKPPNPDASDNFGSAVDVSGDTIVVGAYQEDSNQQGITNGPTASSDNTAGNSGAAYVFRRTVGVWAQEAYIKANNADLTDFFGESVAIDGDTIAVGTSREWSNQTFITNGTGASSNNSASQSGAIYVYKRTGTTWAQEAYIKPSINTPMDSFALVLDIGGDTIVAGAAGDDSSAQMITHGTSIPTDTGASNAGAAYIFQRTGTTWVQEAYLKSTNLDAGDWFGRSVAIDGDEVIISAYNEDSNQTTVTNGDTASSDNSLTESGAVFIFTRDTGVWEQSAYLKAPNADEDDTFGFVVDVSQGTYIVGTHFEDSNQTTITHGTGASSDNSSTSSGAVYVFSN